MLKSRKQRPHKKKKEVKNKTSNYEHLINKKTAREKKTVISSAITEGFAAVKVHEIVSVSLFQMLMC